ncbi:outer membrane biogenesis protein BamB [Polystyrenella longa]|uniref:Outer membrane biogenesis protein BamB n=1 Tax=Polystyrenella longa TaxID=2528007 RepID=A0A518CSN2_9PLAN|nr:PQQ-binding-like beta-propeller repeat protein [Polystyrenella longa]QDU82228.1 outer membrane biogenesis protein BamB [Polystyrenella longa]
MHALSFSTLTTCCLLNLLFWSASSALPGAELIATEWNQLRGPNGQGHPTQESNVPLEWSETENVAWKVPVPGLGWSSPVLSDGKIWLTSAVEEGQVLKAYSFDVESGDLLQEIDVFRPEEPVTVNDQNSHASPTPVVEPGFVYVHFGTMGTACVNSDNGEIVWKHEKLKLEHKEGPGSSPVLFDNLLLINCDGMDVQYVVALDKQTGDIVWKTERSGPFRDRPDFKKAYSTPTVHQVNDRWQVISTGADQIEAYDAYTGEEIWRVIYNGFSNVPLVLVDGTTAYVCTGFTKSELWAIDLTGEGDVTESHVRWKFKRQVPQISSPILVDGRLYFCSDKGVGCCIDASTGEAIWQDRLGGNFSSSPIYVNSHLLFNNHEGKTLVVAPADELNIVRTNSLDGIIKATPAPIPGGLIIRTNSHLYRISK